MRRTLTLALSLLTLSLSPGCYDSGEVAANEGFEIDCRGVPCDWKLMTGHMNVGATWHDGDRGLDLSGTGTTVVEQRAVLLLLTTRQLELAASMFRDPNVSIHIEFDWYAVGQGAGPTFWDRGPHLISQASYDIYETNAFIMHREVLVPSEAAALVLRVRKEGDGRAMIDEITLGHDSGGL